MKLLRPEEFIGGRKKVFKVFQILEPECKWRNGGFSGEKRALNYNFPGIQE